MSRSSSGPSTIPIPPSIRSSRSISSRRFYYTWKYGKPVKPVRRRSECNIPEDCSCPACKAPQPYLYRNNGKAGQLMCKVCGTLFSPDENRFSRTLSLKCPYCSHTLTRKKDRKHFIIHKCVNPKCPYYLHNLKKVDKADLAECILAEIH